MRAPPTVAGWVLVSFLAAVEAAAVGPRRFDGDALEEARRGGRPVLVIVRDPACARCVLDEEEALADAAAARLLQEAFVTARIDRVERPDLDHLFATAVQWLSGERGYPLVVALLPDGRPFAGRAGIGAADRGDAPGLHRFALRAWSDFAHARADAEARAARTAEALARAQRLEPAPLAPGADAAALRGLQDAFDARLGGFGVGEAFAPPAALRLLLAALERGEDAAARRMLARTLDAVAAAEPEPPALARRALLLEAFARATRLFDSPVYRARAAALADGASRLRDAGGAFVAYDAEPGTAPVVAGWNGLMIGALALSGTALDRPQDVAAARTAAAAVLERLGPAARLRRSAGATGALLQDHAYLAEGLLRLHAALGGREPRWADEAAALADAALGRYLDASQGGFFDTLADPPAFVPAALPQRLRNGYDGDLPSANGVMAGVLGRLGHVLAQPRYTDLSRRTVEAFGGALARAPRGMEGLAAAMIEARPAGDSLVPPGEPLPASAEQDGVALAAELRPSPRAGQPFVLRLRITAPPGGYVLAHDPGAADLVGLSVSIPTPGVALAGPILFPPGQRVRGRWGSGTVLAHGGGAATVVEVPLRLASRADAAPAVVRVRVLYQSCHAAAATCERPRSVLLQVPLSGAR